jgi:hypothetical protein
LGWLTGEKVETDLILAMMGEQGVSQHKICEIQLKLTWKTSVERRNQIAGS